MVCTMRNLCACRCDAGWETNTTTWINGEGPRCNAKTLIVEVPVDVATCTSELDCFVQKTLATVLGATGAGCAAIIIVCVIRQRRLAAKEKLRAEKRLRRQTARQTRGRSMHQDMMAVRRHKFADPDDDEPLAFSASSTRPSLVRSNIDPGRTHNGRSHRKSQRPPRPTVTGRLADVDGDEAPDKLGSRRMTINPAYKHRDFERSPSRRMTITPVDKHRDREREPQRHVGRR